MKYGCIIYLYDLFKKDGGQLEKIPESDMDILSTCYRSTDVFPAAYVSRFYGIRGFKRTFQDSYRTTWVCNISAAVFAYGAAGDPCTSAADTGDSAVRKSHEAL